MSLPFTFFLKQPPTITLIAKLSFTISLVTQLIEAVVSWVFSAARSLRLEIKDCS